MLRRDDSSDSDGGYDLSDLYTSEKKESLIKRLEKKLTDNPKRVSRRPQTRRTGLKKDPYVKQNMVSNMKTVKVNGRNLVMLTDTEADKSCLTMEMVRRFGWKREITPLRSDLRNFEGSQIPCRGVIRGNIRWGAKSVRTELVVVDRGYDVLLVTDCEKLWLLKWQKKECRLNKDVVKKSKYYPYQIEVLPGSRLVAAKPIPVSFALGKQVADKINSLLEERVLVPTEQTDWASPIVVVKKPKLNLK